MRVRSYEFYEVRAGRLGIDDRCLHRGNEETCRKWMRNNEENIDANKENLYLVRVQLIEACKADKEEPA